MNIRSHRLSVFAPIAVGALALSAVVAIGGSQTSAAGGGIVAATPQPAVQAPFGRPLAARNTGCPVQCGGGKLLVEHFDGQAGTEKSQVLCLPPPAWENHCFLQDDRGTQAAGHEQDNCCPSPVD